ncbi:alpha/beta fold hydrolase [Mycobacterium koreense]|uniref:Alpha/beta hydrolase n=1 Tax=Mycolicibacillus koreensis TaxID=1069220 RepID=A0A7I7S978_9MYCO|nr:alpha/beta hydrolase [Mycolicibacillus koreensis]MCV7249331.1 alpha/beta fold hydrolase [Mycolicibacillus koreensis]OSC35525.1 alpha/beta hydrolase [Mycolicibacillus koreensis]BBY53243.1 putative hydrolase [Mycolicibacillus koreensis]
MGRLRLLSSVLLAFGTVVAAPAAAAPESPDAHPGTPNWTGCGQLVDTSEIPTAQCTMLAVPVDYADPAGAQARLAVLRVPATGQRVGALLVNPGGPGASAVDAAAGMAAALRDTPVGQHFDLVGFDPRGVGHSTPQLRCRTDAEFDAYRREPMVDYSPAGVAHIEALLSQRAQRCVDRMGAGFLANVGTASAARDMDMVRQLLGEEQINYLGYSYGTQLGAAYLERFGERVRAMVLDGAVDPSVDPIEANVAQMAGFQVAFNDYAADCAHSAGCPLGTDPTKAVARYRALVDPLVARPAPTRDPRGLSYADAITGTLNALYTPQYWTYLTNGLRGLQTGTGADALLALADDYEQRDAQGHYGNIQDSFDAVRCVDATTPTDPAAWVDADRRIRQQAPFLSYREFTGYAPRDVCALWPVPASGAARPVAKAAPGKAVVVSTTHDPATPYQSGVSLARQLGAPLISYEGTQHTVVFSGSRCVDTAVLRYLIHQASPPAQLRC